MCKKARWNSRDARLLKRNLKDHPRTKRKTLKPTISENTFYWVGFSYRRGREEVALTSKVSIARMSVREEGEVPSIAAHRDPES